jgi:hypothetical protein
MMNLFFLLVIIQQQGLLNKINKNSDTKNKHLHHYQTLCPGNLFTEILTQAKSIVCNKAFSR